MNANQGPKRVTRACDHCREKRLKCMGQRPCMNCQLYGAECISSTDQSKDSRSAASASAGRKRKRNTTREQVDHHENEHEAVQPLSHVNQTVHMSLPTTPLEGPEAVPFAQPVDTGPNFDQYALDLGLVFAPFWPQNSPPTMSFNNADGLVESAPSMLSPYPADLPTPGLSADGPAGMTFQSPNLGHTMDLGQYTMGSQLQQNDSTPSRIAHELFLRKGPSDSKFIGMGSIGSTISQCLRYSSPARAGSMEATTLNHLVKGIRHIDELSLSAEFQIPPLPDRDFAKQGIQSYFDFLHLLYPILEVEFLDNWTRIYDGHQSLSAITYCRFCLVVAVGNLVCPKRCDNVTRESAQQWQEQAWYLVDRVMATPFTESVQVMLLHTVFLLYCGKTGIAWMTCGMAVRIGQSIGLHQQTPAQLGLSAEQVILRSRLWAVAYSLDSFLSLSEGRPPAIIGSPNLAPLGRFSDRECPPVVTESSAVHFHDWHIRLAKIANKVLTLLKNGDSTIDELMQIGKIDEQLLAWKDDIPMEFRPDQEILADDPLYCLVAMLHLKYHNLMRTVHWISLNLSTNASASDRSRLAARVRSSESICVSASRAVIDVLNGTSHRRIAGSLGGFIVQYCMAAISTFYWQILKEPTKHSARTNLEHMRTGTLHITTLTEPVGSRTHFRNTFADMLRAAENVVSKSTESSTISQAESGATW